MGEDEDEDLEGEYGELRVVREGDADTEEDSEQVQLEQLTGDADTKHKKSRWAKLRTLRKAVVGISSVSRGVFLFRDSTVADKITRGTLARHSKIDGKPFVEAAAPNDLHSSVHEWEGELQS